MEQVPLCLPLLKCSSETFHALTYYLEGAHCEESESCVKRNAFDLLMSAQQNDTHLSHKISKDKLIATESVQHGC